jgi:hypothetical protein
MATMKRFWPLLKAEYLLGPIVVVGMSVGMAEPSAGKAVALREALDNAEEEHWQEEEEVVVVIAASSAGRISSISMEGRTRSWC